MSATQEKTIYAIDYGTSNSLLAVATAAGVSEPLPLDPKASDPAILRSLLYFPNRQECYYGAAAISEFNDRGLEGRFIRSIKKYLPVQSFQGTFVEERPIGIEEIIGTFLREMKRRADLYLQKDVTSVVLGRPAKFSLNPAEDKLAQNRLEAAARRAGFKHIEFCPEPLAAAFSYRQQLTESKIVLVADFGGGTSDFTVVRISPEDYKDEDVLAIGGVPVAGDSFDSCLMRHRISPHFGAQVTYTVPFGKNVMQMPKVLMENICSPADIVLLRDRDTLEFFRNLRSWSVGGEDQVKLNQLFSLIEDHLGFPVFEEIDQAKRRLSTAESTVFRYTYPGVDITQALERADFNNFSRDKTDEILHALDQTIADAGLQPEDIDLVCSTGGTAKLPILQEELIWRFGVEKISQYNHFQSVVRGLGERARQLI